MAPAKMPWFRWYCETTRDPKLRRIPADQRWVWPAVLTIARSSPRPGVLCISDGVLATIEDIADEAAVTVPVTRKALEAFERVGMIEQVGPNGGWLVPHFSGRQFESDDSNARSKKRRSNGDATVHQLPINDRSTPKQRPQTDRRQRTESELHHPVTDRPADCDESVGRVLDIAARAIYRADPESCRKDPDDYVAGIRANMLRERVLEAQLALSATGNEIDAAAEMVSSKHYAILAAVDLGYAQAGETA